jgi:beta-lactamase class A
MNATDRLTAEIERFAADAHGVIGVSAVHLGNALRVGVRDDLPFPMASTYKVPIAAVVLEHVDRGDLSLDQRLTVETPEFVAGGPIGTYLRPGEAALSVHTLLDLMLTESDNSATDTLMRAVGGGAVITAALRAAGVEGISVDRPTSGIIQDGYGMSFPADPLDRLAYFRHELTHEAVEPPEAARRYDADERDGATPAAMTSLLQRIYERDPRLMSEPSVDVLLEIMERCKTSYRRIRAMLPKGTRVYDKTGTFGGTTNDVGIVELPGAAGAFALSIFIRGASVPTLESERVIADVARALYDYFLFVL